MTRRYRRRPGVAWRELGADAFLARESDAAVYRANETAGALWRLLAEPHTAAEAAGVFRAAFPAAAPGRVERAIGELIERLVEEGLVEAVGEGGAPPSPGPGPA